MGFDDIDDERAFWDDEPRRSGRRPRTATRRATPTPARTPARRAASTSGTGGHPALSARAAAAAAASAGRTGSRRHGDPTTTIRVVEPSAPVAAAPLSDIWDDDWADQQQPAARSLDDIWAEPPAAPGRRAHTGAPARRTPARRGRPGRAGTRDPLVLRLGLLAGACAVLVPVAFALDSDAAPELRSATPVAGAAVLPAAGVAANPATDAALDTASTLVVTDPAVADTERTDATSTASTDASTSAAATAASPTDAASTEAPATQAPATDAASTDAPSTEAPSTEAPTTEATTTTLDPASAHAAAVAACGNTYEIAPGDYWIGIAGAIDTPLADLLELNAATVATPLYAGRDVCLPAGVQMPAPTTAPATTSAPATTAPKSSTSAPATTAPKSTTTTPATTVPKTTTTTEAPPKNTYSRAEVEAIIREIWPDDLEDEAVRIATRESNLIPTVRNYCCYGLFQIYYSVHKSWLAQMGVTSASQLYDPRVNATAAYALYQRSGSWAPWAL